MNYSPGTLFRIYLKDKHYTAVLIKNGKVLEVKKPDTNIKTIYDTLEKWCKAHNVSIDKVVIDYTNVSGVVINGDKYGFNYPTDNLSEYKWLKWCYEIICEIKPSLLEDEIIKTNYNNLVKATKVFSPYINYKFYYYHIPKQYKYCNSNFRFNTKKQWYGYCNFDYYFLDNPINIESEVYINAHNIICKSYKTLCELIRPHVADYMEHKYSYIYNKYHITRCKKAIKRAEKKIKSYTENIEYYIKSIPILKSAIIKYTKQLGSY